MSDDLTDVSGIGQKTAEKLRNEGIQTKAELLSAFTNGDPTVVGNQFEDGLNKRALDGIRDELADRGEEFTDPVFGVPVREDNRKAVDAFDLRLGTDVASGFGEFTRDNPGFQNRRNVLDLTSLALKGRLDRKLGSESYDELIEDSGDRMFGTSGALSELDDADRARKEAREFALDAAGNISEFDRETVERGNRLASTVSRGRPLVGEQTKPVTREIDGEEREAEDNVVVDPAEYARAVNINRQRSAEARRVDSRRRAPVTDEISTWREDPAHFDYPGVDTPGGVGDFVSEENREVAREARRAVREADPDVVTIAFGEEVR
jgi:hypothetical protein